MKRWAVLLFLMAAPALARPVSDQIGGTVELSDHPTRVVALMPALSEWVVEIGGEGRLVGVVEWSDFPASIKSLPTVGGYPKVNLEKILSLKPDLVVASTDGNARDQIQQLRELKVPVFVVNTATLKDMEDSIPFLARALGDEARGADVLKAFQKELGAFRARGASRSTRSVVFQLSFEPLMVVGGKSFINDMIGALAARNAYGELPVGYPKVSKEDILKRNPECILSTDAKSLEAWTRFKRLRAAQTGCLKVVPADWVLRPSPRVLKGLKAIEEAIYP